MSRLCPGCGGEKSKRAELCVGCRRKATQLGVSVLVNVSTPVAPMIPRTPKQNSVYHGRLREIAVLEKPGIAQAELWAAERALKRWALVQASAMFGREVKSSTELSEIEMEALLDFLGDVIDDLNDGRKRRRRARRR